MLVYVTVSLSGSLVLNYSSLEWLTNFESQLALLIVSFNSGFLSVYAQEWDCWIIRQFYFQFLKESPHCSPQWILVFLSGT